LRRSKNPALRKLSKGGQRLHLAYEAGPLSYNLYRLSTGLGHRCDVVAPSLIPRNAADKVKTDRRDAMMLAQLLRAGQLSEVWVPDEAHEAMRDLVRMRAQAMKDLRKTVSGLLAPRLAGDRRVAALGDVEELAAQVRPAERERNRLAGSFVGDGLVGRVAVALAERHAIEEPQGTDDLVQRRSGGPVATR
jgi:transposase